ncbi:MAG: tetratricopeptide repeat protein [Saprospiraceae bacterium]
MQHTAYAQATHTPLLKGDRAFERAQYKAAEKQYRIAADLDRSNPQAVYNLGNTLFQQGNYEDAEQRFKQATGIIKTPSRQADALHNLGDAFLKQRKYKDAVRAYEESLRLRPADPGTKQNLQMAKKKLKEEEKKEKEQQQKNQQEQQDQQNQNQDQQNQKNPESQQDPQQNQPNQPQQNQQGQPQQPQREQQKKQEEHRLKKEDAKRLLETAVGPDDRKNAQKYRAAQKQSNTKTPKKDW